MNKSLEIVTKLVGALGVLTATGYFSICTFMSRFHVRDHGGEFLRAKYVYVGTLCWLFPIGMLLPIWGLFFLQKTIQENKRQMRLRETRPGRTVRLGLAEVLRSFFVAATPESAGVDPRQIEFKEDVDGLSIALVTFVPWVIYLMVEFARPGLNLPPWWVGTATFITFLLLSALDVSSASYSVRRFVRLGCAWIICLTLVIWGIHFLAFVIHILFSGAIIYYVLTLSASIILLRTWHFCKGDKTGARPFALTTGIALSSLLMIIAVLAYGAFVFPYVPASRGGGDYTVLADTAIQLKEGVKVCPDFRETDIAQCRATFTAMRFKIIDSTENSFFLADTSTGGGPCGWRGFPTTLAEETNIPVIYEINKSDIAASVSVMPLNQRCAEYSDNFRRWLTDREFVAGLLLRCRSAEGTATAALEALWQRILRAVLCASRCTPVVRA